MNSRQLDDEAIFDVAREIPNRDVLATYFDQVCAGDSATCMAQICERCSTSGRVLPPASR